MAVLDRSKSPPFVNVEMPFAGREGNDDETGPPIEVPEPKSSAPTAIAPSSATRQVVVITTTNQLHAAAASLSRLESRERGVEITADELRTILGLLDDVGRAVADVREFAENFLDSSGATHGETG